MESSVESRILSSRARLLGTSDPDSLQNVIPSIYPEGAMTWVSDQSSFYVLHKFSTAAVSAPTVIATALGAGVPGRWVKYQVGSDTITPLPLALVVDRGAPPGGNGAYSGDKAYASMTDAMAAISDGGTLQVAPGNYRVDPTVTITEKSVAIVGLGGRGNTPHGNRLVARLPRITWSVVLVELLFLEKVDAELLGTQQIGIQARDSVISSTGVGCLASISLTNGTIDGHAAIMSCEGAGTGNLTTATTRLTDCEIGGDIIATTSVNIYSSQFLSAVTITSPSITIDAQSYRDALAMGVTFSSIPTVLSLLPSALISVVVPALGADELGYVDVSTAGTVLSGLTTADMVTVNPTTDLAAAGANGGFVGQPRVSAPGTIRVPFKGSLAGGAVDFRFSKVS